MKAEESLALIYKIFESEFGPYEARKSVSLIVSVVIGDIQDQKLPMTEELIIQGLEKYVEDFKLASKKSIA